MARLDWNAPGTRTYETGVDRGVLYVDGMGHAWSGLLSVEEAPTGGEATPYYYDGIKYANVASYEEFEAAITALSAPKAFLALEGVGNIARGLYATQQPRKPFSFSYRTLTGSDTGELGAHYKLHIIYNALAGPSSRENVTLSDTPEPMELSWDITTTPPRVSGYRPTAHFVIDSREASPIILGWLESIMYGTVEKQPRLPRLDEILTMFGWETDNIDIPVNVVGEWDSPKATVTNLFTNPRFEATSGTVEVYRNLATNPSFEATAGTIEVWRNLHVNPDLQSGIAGWDRVPSPGLGAPTRVVDTGGGAIGFNQGFALRVESPLGSTDNEAVTISGDISVTAGQTVTISFYFLSGTGSGTGGRSWVQIRPRIQWNDNSFTEGETYLSYYEYARYSLTTVVPEGKTSLRLRPLIVGGMRQGGAARYRRAMVQISDTLTPYFDGNYSPDPDLTPSWTADVNNSPSVLTGKQLGGVGYASSGFKVIQSTQGPWGGYSARVIRVLPGYAQFILNRVPIGGSASVQLRAYSPTLQSSSLVSFRRYDSPYTAYGLNGEYNPEGFDLGRTVLNTTGWGQGEVHGQLTSLPVGESVWFDNLVIVEGEYNGPYFDGDTSPDPNLTPSWTGSVNGSPSVLTGTRALAVTPPYTGQAKSYVTTGGPVGGSRALRAVLGHSDVIGIPVANILPVQGQEYTLSLWVRAPKPTMMSLRISGTESPRRVIGTEWTHITHTAIAGAQNAYGTGPYLPPYAGHREGDTLDVYLPTLVEGNRPELIPFSGEALSAPYRGQLPKPKWNGTPDNSTSYFDYYTDMPPTPSVGDSYVLEGVLWVWTDKNCWQPFGTPPVTI